jgi:CubicO group peptidase (beta-lactamase class C family)
MIGDGAEPHRSARIELKGLAMAHRILTSRLLAGLLALAAAIPSVADAQATVPDLSTVTSKIEIEVERLLRDIGIPAISIALVVDGQVVWAEAFGHANVAAGVRATADTYFSTGSTLKPVTAAAIMQLVDAGELTLDTPFNEIVGAALAIEGADDVTLRHMLGHHSGLEGPLNIVPLWSRESLSSPEEVAGATKRVTEPGVEYRYCNECYVLAGLVIERLSGLTFDDYLAERIFGPLGAGPVVPSVPTPAMIERLALPYGTEDRVTVPIGQIRTDVFAAGDAYLRAMDMAAFLAVLLNGGSYGGERILSESSVDEIVRRQFEGSNSGLGINVSELEGREVVTKNGIFTGYHSFMIGDRASRHGVYVVSNSTAAGRPIALLARYALRLLWGEQPEPSRERSRFTDAGAPRRAGPANQSRARVNVTCVTPLGEEVASTW